MRFRWCREEVRNPDSLLSISSVENSTHGMSEGRTMSILGATLPFWAPMETLLCWSLAICGSVTAVIICPRAWAHRPPGVPGWRWERPQPVDSGRHAGGRETEICGGLDYQLLPMGVCGCRHQGCWQPRQGVSHCIASPASLPHGALLLFSFHVRSDLKQQYQISAPI